MKKMKPLTNEQQKSYEDKHAKNKNYRKVRDHCHCTGVYKVAAHSICDLNDSVPKEIAIVFLQWI